MAGCEYSSGAECWLCMFKVLGLILSTKSRAPHCFCVLGELRLDRLFLHMNQQSTWNMGLVKISKHEEPGTRQALWLCCAEVSQLITWPSIF